MPSAEWGGGGTSTYSDHTWNRHRRPALLACALALLTALACEPQLEVCVDSRRRTVTYDPATDIWGGGPGMPRARVSPACAELGGMIYVSGGSSYDHGEGTYHLFRLDPAAGTWKQLARMPYYRVDHELVPLGADLYAVGGRHYDPNGDPVDTVEVYDTLADSWSAGPSLTVARADFGVVELAGLIFALGGDGPLGPLDSAEVLDVASGTWRMLAPMPVDSPDVTAETDGALIYVMGSMKVPPWTSEVEIYDPVMDAWSRGPGMPVSDFVAEMESAVIGSEIFTIFYDDRNRTGLVSFDTITLSWTMRSDLPGNVWGVGFAESGGLLYTFGGGIPTRCHLE